MKKHQVKMVEKRNQDELHGLQNKSLEIVMRDNDCRELHNLISNLD